MKIITVKKFSRLVKKFQKKGKWFDVRIGWDETDPSVLIYYKKGEKVERCIE